MIDAYKYKTEWEENHMVGVHVRRGDLTIYGKNVSFLCLKTHQSNNVVTVGRVLVMERPDFGLSTTQGCLTLTLQTTLRVSVSVDGSDAFLNI